MNSRIWHGEGRLPTVLRNHPPSPPPLKPPLPLIHHVIHQPPLLASGPENRSAQPSFVRSLLITRPCFSRSNRLGRPGTCTLPLSSSIGRAASLRVGTSASRRAPSSSRTGSLPLTRGAGAAPNKGQRHCLDGDRFALVWQHHPASGLPGGGGHGAGGGGQEAAGSDRDGDERPELAAPLLHLPAWHDLSGARTAKQDNRAAAPA